MKKVNLSPETLAGLYASVLEDAEAFSRPVAAPVAPVVAPAGPEAAAVPLAEPDPALAAVAPLEPAPPSPSVSAQKPERTRGERIQRARRRIMAIGAVMLAFAGGDVTNTFVSSFGNHAGATDTTRPSTSGVPSTTTTTEAPVIITTTIEVASETTEEEAPETTKAPVTTVAPTTTEAPTTTAAPTTTETASTTTEATTTTEAPKPLTFSEEIKTGVREVMNAKGIKVGQLVFDKYCTVIEVYVENPVPYAIDANQVILSEEAKVLAEQLKRTDLSPKDRLAIEDTIMQRGLSDGNGSPMYYIMPDKNLAAGCMPTARDTRADQTVYGSYDANAWGNQGIKASALQAVADIVPEMGQIPGMEDITYIQGHRSSQSAAFHGLSSFNRGDTVTYQGDDGVAYHYELAQQITINEVITPAQLKQFLLDNGTASGDLVLQVCIEGQPDNRALYIFKPVVA